MNVLVATHETQGYRDNDFCWTDEGELVVASGHRCDRHDDGPCGCSRSVVGLTSRKSTTTALVAALAITKGDFENAYAESMVRAGFTVDPREMEFTVGLMLDVAAQFVPGTVLEYRCDGFRERLKV